MLIYVGDLITDIPGLFLGGLIASSLQAEVTLLSVFSKDKAKELLKNKVKNYWIRLASRFLIRWSKPE